VPSVPSDSSSTSSPSHPHTIKSSVDEKGQQELDALRKNPEEFRTLITGVQIFLGRFGYGVGPYSGILDQSTKNALKAYQEKTGLSQTGDIDFPTLKRLTEDDRLPPQTFHDQEWEKWVEVQGSWMLKEGNTDDVLQTSRITCMREFERCIESTASLVNASVPRLKVHTLVYDIKEWNDANIVSAPYDGEACAVSILRISRNPPMATRFVSLQGKPGPCRNVKAEDRQYVLEDGPKIYQILRMQKADAIQQILQVTK
jgi:peptidoglycan hydrolase-like protein with peptidoglycan-binding domain